MVDRSRKISMPSDNEIAQLSSRIDDLVQRIERIADPAVRANVIALIQSLLELHGRAIGRLSELLLQSGETGHKILKDFASDEVVAGLMLLYECHPESLETRLEKAVNRIQEYVRPSGGDVKLLEIDGGRVRVRMSVSGSGCCGNQSAVKKTVEDILYSFAPDVTAIEIETETKPGVRDDLVQVQLKTVPA